MRINNEETNKSDFEIPHILDHLRTKRQINKEVIIEKVSYEK